MRRYIYIGVGGFIGAISRYTVKNWQIPNNLDLIYLNTFIINITGCFVLAFFLRLAFDIWETDSDLRLGIATGFIGAFTTFSTLCRETGVLLLNGSIVSSLIYLMLSVAAGLTAVYLGNAGAKVVIDLKALGENDSKFS